MKFTRKQLKDYGFTENKVSVEECGGRPFTYYTFDIDKYIRLISEAFHKGEKEKQVEFFEGDGRALSKEFVEACIKEFKD
jgi:hypothetical protein